MNVFDFAKHLLLNGEIESKLLSPAKVTDWDVPHTYNVLEVENPARTSDILFSKKQFKFPKKNRFRESSARAMAMHSFANHELLAVEMMAASILKFPLVGPEGIKFRKCLVSTIKDEQKHLKLYMNRISEMGLTFGELPLNSYFWGQMNELSSPESYFALMSLTFEAANLDFASFYKDIFKEYEDHKSADLMEVVLKDEIAHVLFGANWLKSTKGNSSLYDYYASLLPERVTPARAKGIVFKADLRNEAGLDKDFVDSIEYYKDDFKVTNRREWK